MAKKVFIAACAYAAIGILSFGHAAAHAQRDEAACEERRLTQPVEVREICLYEPTFSGGAAALLWPLYWSWEFQS